MKCTKCGKEHAIYHYVTNINGDKNETHLCEECANKLKAEAGEYPWESFDKLMNDSFNSFFNNDPWMRSLMPRGFMNSRPRSLFDSFFSDDFFSLPRMGTMMLPAFFIPTGRPAQQTETEEKVKSVDEAEAQAKAEEAAPRAQADAKQEKPTVQARRVDEGFARRREINALRAQMHRAARNEDYETAAKLRDQLRQLEGTAGA